jgi:23S rRNA pseudouridine2605 synthase
VVAVSEKLQKVLARVGLGSRREIEGWIQAGRVTVDGKVAELGCRVTPAVKIRVDNKPIKVIKTQRLKTRVLLYHKPLGEICTRSIGCCI